MSTIKGVKMRKVFYLALISAIYLMFLLFSSLLFAEDVTFVIGGENGKIRSLRGINIGPLSSGALTASFSIPIIEGVDISNLKGGNFICWIWVE